MFRYLKLYANFLRFSLSQFMEFRMDFWFRILMDCVYYGTHIAFFKIIYLHTPVLAGWNEQQVMIFVAGYLLVDAAQMTLFSNNLWVFPQLVNKGGLDYYLLRPVSSLFFLSLRSVAVNSFVNFLMALGIMVWAFSRYEGSFSLSWMLFYFLLLFNGLILFYLVRLLFILPVFWTHSAQGFQRVMWTLTQLSEKPDRIFYGTTRYILLTILPFGLVASVPTRFLFGQVTIYEVLLCFVVSAVFSLMVCLVWKWGIASYSSASS